MVAVDFSVMNSGAASADVRLQGAQAAANADSPLNGEA